MSRAVLDDHLLRDLLADDIGSALGRVLATYEPATTNLYYVRLCKSVLSARGGQLTGGWPAERRHALGRVLVELPATLEVVPMRLLAFRVAEIAATQRVSTLGAEAVAAAQNLRGPLCVWQGDDGPGIRAAAKASRVPYRTIAH